LTQDANHGVERWTSCRRNGPTPTARLYTRNIDDFARPEEHLDIIAI
jgi:hypothetical protein